jgi:hypothetical protein
VVLEEKEVFIGLFWRRNLTPGPGSLEARSQKRGEPRRRGFAVKSEKEELKGLNL